MSNVDRQASQVDTRLRAKAYAGLKLRLASLNSLERVIDERLIRCPLCGVHCHARFADSAASGDIESKEGTIISDPTRIRRLCEDDVGRWRIMNVCQSNKEKELEM